MEDDELVWLKCCLICLASVTERFDPFRCFYFWVKGDFISFTVLLLLGWSLSVSPIIPPSLFCHIFSYFKYLFIFLMNPLRSFSHFLIASFILFLNFHLSFFKYSVP